MAKPRSRASRASSAGPSAIPARRRGVSRCPTGAGWRSRCCPCTGRSPRRARRRRRRPEHAVAADVHVVRVLVATAVGRRRRLRCGGRRLRRDGGLGRRFRGLRGLGGDDGRSRGLRPGRLRPRPGLRGCRRGCERGRGARLRPLERTGHPSRALGRARRPSGCGRTDDVRRHGLRCPSGPAGRRRSGRRPDDDGDHDERGRQGDRRDRAPPVGGPATSSAEAGDERGHDRDEAQQQAHTRGRRDHGEERAEQDDDERRRTEPVARTLRGISLHYRPPLAVGRCDRSSSAGWRALPLCASRDEARGR
jgi:hypothetical protein